MALVVISSSRVAYLFSLDFARYTSIITVITKQSTIFLVAFSYIPASLIQTLDITIKELSLIIDRVEYYNYYPYGSAWSTAFGFLDSISSDSEEKKYEIQGDDIYAIIASYNTKEPHKFEAHREYVDIQCLLEGQEIIESTALNGLAVDTPYDSEKDVEFYVKTDSRKIISPLMPGIFIAFFPHDAHMPGVSVGNSPAIVKKVVVKIRAWLLRL